MIFAMDEAATQHDLPTDVRALAAARVAGHPVPDGFVVARYDAAALDAATAALAARLGASLDAAALDAATAALAARLGASLDDAGAPLFLTVRGSLAMDGLDAHVGLGDATLPALAARIGEPEAKAVLDVAKRAGAAGPASAALHALVRRASLPVVIHASVFARAAMPSGIFTATSVDPVHGDEGLAGELVRPGVRGGVPVRSARGDGLVDKLPALVDRVGPIVAALDRELGTPVQARFVVERGVPWLVSVHPARLSPDALARTLVRRVADGRLTREAAIASLTPDTLEATGKFELVTDGTTEIGRGLAASPGAAAGRIAISAAQVTGASDGDPRVMVVDDAAPEDAAGIRGAAAIVATSGGLTADAAIAARALRKPCVVSAPIRIGPGDLSVGDWITVDGTTGAIHRGALPVRWRPGTPEAETLVSWLAPAHGESPAQSLTRHRQASRGV